MLLGLFPWRPQLLYTALRVILTPPWHGRMVLEDVWRSLEAPREQALDCIAQHETHGPVPVVAPRGDYLLIWPELAPRAIAGNVTAMYRKSDQKMEQPREQSLCVPC